MAETQHIVTPKTPGGTAPSGYPTEIIGYVEPWIATPGETVAVKVCFPPLATLRTRGEYSYKSGANNARRSHQQSRS